LLEAFLTIATEFHELAITGAPDVAILTVLAGAMVISNGPDPVREMVPPPSLVLNIEPEAVGLILKRIETGFKVGTDVPAAVPAVGMVI
jgi:hypothetical protein